MVYEEKSLPIFFTFRFHRKWLRFQIFKRNTLHIPIFLDFRGNLDQCVTTHVFTAVKIMAVKSMNLEILLANLTIILHCICLVDVLRDVNMKNMKCNFMSSPDDIPAFFVVDYIYSVLCIHWKLHVYFLYLKVVRNLMSVIIDL